MDFKNIPNMGRTVNGRPLVIDESKNEGIQGTILCSNLFTPVVQELYNLITMSGLTPSADNTQVYQLFQRVRDSLGTLQAEVASLQSTLNWLQSNIVPMIDASVVSHLVPVNNALTQLQNNINAQATNFDNQIAQLKAQMEQENTALQNLIQSGIQQKVDTLNSELAAETAARQAAEQNITNTLNDLAQRIIDGNDGIINVLQNMIGKAIASANTAINQEISDRKAADDDLAQTIHDGNEELAATIRQLYGNVTTANGNTSVALTQEINDRKAAINNLAQLIYNGNEEITTTLKSLIGDAVNVSSSSLAQEAAAREAADVNLAKAIHDGNEEITTTLTAMIGKALVQSSVPVGTILPFSNNNVPSGYLICNGAAFDQTQYASLYADLGVAQVPDLRGMFLRGLDTTGTADRDGLTRTLLSFQEGSRLLSEYGTNAPHFYINGDTSDSNPDSMKNIGWDPRANTSQSYPYHAAEWNGGSDTTNNSFSHASGWDMVGIARPKNVAVNYIIKAI